jgi:hypothetical protein
MRYQREVQGQRKPRPDTQPKEGIKKGRLEISQERGPTEIMRVPKWKMALAELLQSELAPDRKMQEKIVLFA